VPEALLFKLARPLGALGNTTEHHREAQRRGCGGIGRLDHREAPVRPGQTIFPRAQLTPEALGAHQKAEIQKWWPIIKAAGIKSE